MGFVRTIRIALLSPWKRKLLATISLAILVVLLFFWLNSSPSHVPAEHLLELSNLDWARGSQLDPHAVKPYSRPLVQFHTPDLAKWASSNQHGNIWIVAEEYVGLGKYGGIGTAFFELAKVLSRAHHNVTVLYLQKLSRSTQPYIQQARIFTFNSFIIIFSRLSPPFTQHLSDHGIRIVPLDLGKMPIFASGQAQISHRVFEHLMAVTNSAPATVNPIDVVHFADFGGYAYYSLLAKHQV